MTPDDRGLEPLGTQAPPEEPAPATQLPINLSNSGAQAVLDQFRGSPLLSEGKLSVIGLEAIADRLGPRWPSRRELVFEHAERVLRRSMGAHVVVQRISETEYLVGQSDLPRMAGQLQCLNCLRELLQRFLGEALDADLKVHEVTRITDCGVFGQRLDVGRVVADAAAERTRAPPQPAEAPAPSLDRWSPFTTSAGQRIGVSCSLEPVLHLKQSSRIGYRVASRVQHQPGFAALTRGEWNRLAPADLERIDFATIARGLDRIRATAAMGKPPSLIVPISYATLQSSRARAVIVGLLRKAKELVVHGVICEITGIEGAPPAAFLQATSTIRPFCRNVIGRLADPESNDARHLVGVRLDGLSTRCPTFEGEAQFLGWLSSFVRVNGAVAKTIFLYQVQDLARARLAADHGVSHVTLAPHRAKIHFIDDEPF